MNKTTKELSTINCGACGYKTCEHMAIAIFNDCNCESSCVHYIKDQAEERGRQAQLAAEESAAANIEIKRRNDLIAGIVEGLNADFGELDLSIHQMANGNSNNAQESTAITGAMAEVTV